MSNASINNDTTLETPVTVPNGGTGNSSLTAYALLAGGTTSTDPVQSLASVGTSGQVLTSNGAAALPTFQDAAGGSALTLISTATASNSATVEFTGLSTDFLYLIVIEGLAPATDQVQFWMRTSTNNGATYDSGAGNYQWIVQTLRTTGADSGVGSSGDTEITLTNTSLTNFLMGNAANENGSYTISLYNPSGTRFTKITCEGTYQSEDGTHLKLSAAGVRTSAADVDAIRFLMSSGNISTGNFRLYGLAAS